MFCPSCGLEDKQSNQFCRACGADLRLIRNALAKPDGITVSAASAREEIGRAFAAKILEAENAVEMKIVAEDVLPQIEKFLESPAEKRLPRIRVGTIVTSVGLGVTLLLAPFAVVEPEAFFMPAAGLLVFFVGLAVWLNGWLFTVPPNTVENRATEAMRQRELDADTTSQLVLPEAAANYEFSSVVENTTRHLKEKQTPRG